MIWKDQSATFPTKIAWSWSAIDHVQSPADWHKNRAGARHILSVYLAETDIQNNFKNRTKYKITSTTSTRSHANKNKHTNNNWFRQHLDRICPLRTLETAFQSTKLSKFSGGACPQTHLVAAPFSASLIRRWLKKPTILYTYVGQSFCINMITSVFNSSKWKNN